jgi:hypothetical protein
MTLKQLRERVQQEIGLQDIEDYSEIGLVNDLIYQGTIDMLSRTRCTVRCVHLQTKKDESTYVLDHSILALVDIDDGSDRRRRRDETDTGYTLIRSDLLRLNPAPSEDGEIDVWAVMQPTQMTADADSPNQENFGAIPIEYHDAIFLYACWYGASYADDESAAQGERYRTLYEGADGNAGRLAQIKKLVNKRGTARAPRRRVNVRLVTSHSNYVG